jgi:hypothetical protein
MNKFKPMDFIAVIIIIGGFLLLYMGKDGIVGSTLTLITGYYFGKRASKMPTNHEQTQNNGTTKITDN